MYIGPDKATHYGAQSFFREALNHYCLFGGEYILITDGSVQPRCFGGVRLMSDAWCIKSEQMVYIAPDLFDKCSERLVQFIILHELAHMCQTQEMLDSGSFEQSWGVPHAQKVSEKDANSRAVMHPMFRPLRHSDLVALDSNISFVMYEHLRLAGFPVTF